MSNHNQKSQLSDERAIAIAKVNFVDMVLTGVANVAGNRARTIETKKEKANCPRRQRKEKRWTLDY